MPELPEVETIRRQLAPLVEGARIVELMVGDGRWCLPLAADELADAVRGRRIASLSRRGKYLIWELTGEVFLVMHLRMTGTLLYDPEVDVPHTRAMIDLGAHRVSFVDPRRFGTAQLVLGRSAVEDFFAERLGFEPLDERFTAAHLWTATRNRRVAIKPFLLDQRRVAGVGNIYADEALFRARVHPLRPAGGLTRAQCARLQVAVLETLQAGIDARGASIDDFRDVEGARGSFQNEFLVHRRAGEPCPVCGAAIRKLVVGGRGTYVCEHCQPRPRQRPSGRAFQPSGLQH